MNIPIHRIGKSFDRFSMDPKSQSPIIVATRNLGKLREFEEMLSDFPFQLLSLHQFPDVVEVQEVGTNFLENAVLKASGYALQTGLSTLADDSGLEVYALDGEPGVLSARYAGAAASDSERTAKLLSALSESNSTDRRARFVCVIAIYDAKTKLYRTFEGTCEGRVGLEPTGSNGFGYDPIFIPDGFTKSFGSLDESTKSAISHRGRAMKRAREYLLALYDPPLDPQ